MSKYGSYLPRPFPLNGSVFERISRGTSFRDTRRETSLPLNDATGDGEFRTDPIAAHRPCADADTGGEPGRTTTRVPTLTRL